MLDAPINPAPAFPAFPTQEGVTVTEVLGRSVATIVVRNGQLAGLRAAVERAYRVTLLDGPQRSDGAGVVFLGMGPGKWLAVSDAPTKFASLEPFAAVVDQSGAYGILRLAGEGAAGLLARAVAIDLDLGLFPSGSVATTVIEHVGVTMVRIADAPPAFELYVVRSYAGSLAHWLSEAMG